MGKSCLKCGSIGTGVVITLITDVLIEGACDIVAKGLKTIVDIFKE